jgi:hypothetical protein
VLKKNIWANFQRIIELFTQKIVTKLSKVWVWDPGFEIRDPGPGKNLFRIPDPDPGSGSATLLEIVDFLSLGEQRSCDGRGGAQRPVGRGNEPKKTGVRSARARTRGQNTLVNHIFI